MNAVKSLLAALTIGSAIFLGSVAQAATTSGVLTLDGLSFLSFESTETLAIPAGSTLRFDFKEAQSTGSVSFEIRPEGVAIGPIPMGGNNGSLQYRLAAPATGTLSPGGTGLKLSFTAQVSVTRTDSESTTDAVHTLYFTTEATSATGSKTGKSVNIEGMKIVPQARYVQLVGATSNGQRAALHPGRAISTVLSGTFDWLPAIAE